MHEPFATVLHSLERSREIYSKENSENFKRTAGKLESLLAKRSAAGLLVFHIFVMSILHA